MKKSRYHDFILFTDGAKFDSRNMLIEFTVRVFESPAGEGEQPEPVEIPDYAALNRQRRQLGNRLLDTEEQLDYGILLSKLIFPPKALKLFRESLAGLSPDEGLRLRLRLLDELAIFPWEYCCLPQEHRRPNLSSFLCLDRRISIVRHEAMEIAPENPPPSDSRQIFIAMASPKPYLDNRLLESLPEEQQLIKQAIYDFDSTRTHVLCLPEYLTQDDLLSKPGASLEGIHREMGSLDHVDIFHFSGHGKFDPEMGDTFATSKGKGSVILANEVNGAVPIPGDRFAEVLRERGIRLVILGACETGTRDIFTAWSSVAVKLLQGRIPSVIAMQFRIYDNYAAVFMAALYEALADGRTIDEAVFQGRIAIRARSASLGQEVRDWGTPVLYSRVHLEHIFPPINDDALRQRAQQSIESRTNLYQTWWEWMDHGATVSKSQLRIFAKHAESMELSPMQILILLRSAVVEGVSVQPWLTLMRQKCVELIQQLDDPGTMATQSQLAERSVLSLDEIPTRDRPGEIGQVSWIAVAHPGQDSLVRQTAALTLTALPPIPDEGLARIDKALENIGSSLERFKRKIELRGSLSDHDPVIEAHNTRLPPWERLGIWSWRVIKQVRRDRDRIRKLVFGGSMGAGIALGILRGILGFIAGPLYRARFAMSFFWGAILGLAISLGYGLAGPLSLGVDSQPRKTSHQDERKLTQEFPSQTRTILLSTILFGIAHIFVGWFNGLALGERPLLIVTGTITGLGISIALKNLHNEHTKSVRSWITRAAIAAVTAILAQWIIIINNETWAATSVTRTGKHIQAGFGQYPQIKAFISDHLSFFTYLDPAIVGILLSLGIAIGWYLTSKQKAKIMEKDKWIS